MDLCQDSVYTGAGALHDVQLAARGHLGWLHVSLRL